MVKNEVLEKPSSSPASLFSFATSKCDKPVKTKYILQLLLWNPQRLIFSRIKSAISLI